MKRLICILSVLLLLGNLISCSIIGTTVPPSYCMHSDADDNGVCDECTQSVLVAVDLYAVNDLHGKIFDTDSQPGVDELNCYLRLQKKKNPNTLLLSSGDMWQGSSESNSTKGLIVTDWMNEVGFVSMTLGNHEYDWGEQAIRDNEALAEFPFLAINIYERDSGEQVDYCQSSVFVDLGEVQVGIIGAMGDCYSSISSDKVEDVYFIVGDELTELVKAESESLRALGADLIVYSIHDGGSSYSDQSYSHYDVTLSDGYVDIVFEGHSHKSYVNQDRFGTYHVQGGGDNYGMTHAKAYINSVTGTSVVSTAELIPTKMYANYGGDTVMQKLADKYYEQLMIGDRLLGNNARNRSSGEIKQKVAELYLELGQTAWGEQYDLVLGGGFISTRSPYDLAAGEVRYADLQMLLPFDNQIVLGSIKGSDLLRKFINTSNSNYYITYSDYGNGVKGSIDPNATYYIITDTYSATYAPNRITVVDTYDDTTFARDLIADYIQSGGWSE